MPPLLFTLVCDGQDRANALLDPSLRARHCRQAKTAFIGPQVKLHLDYMEAELGKSTWFAWRERVIYFRTLADYHRLRALAETGQRFAVIGGGFIGSEIAAALAGLEKEVAMIFPENGHRRARFARRNLPQS